MKEHRQEDEEGEAVFLGEKRQGVENQGEAQVPPSARLVVAKGERQGQEEEETRQELVPPLYVGDRLGVDRVDGEDEGGEERRGAPR